MSENKKPKEGYYSTLTGARRCVPIVLFACALFVGVCFITKSVGALGEGISSLLLGLFSFGAYAIPPLLVIHAILRRGLYQKTHRFKGYLFGSYRRFDFGDRIRYRFLGTGIPFQPCWVLQHQKRGRTRRQHGCLRARAVPRQSWRNHSCACTDCGVRYLLLC